MTRQKRIARSLFPGRLSSETCFPEHIFCRRSNHPEASSLPSCEYTPISSPTKGCAHIGNNTLLWPCNDSLGRNQLCNQFPPICRHVNPFSSTIIVVRITRKTNGNRATSRQSNHTTPPSFHTSLIEELKWSTSTLDSDLNLNWRKALWTGRSNINYVWAPPTTDGGRRMKFVRLTRQHQRRSPHR